MKGDPIRVLIAEDQSLVRRGLVAIVNMEECALVIGEAADGHRGSNPPSRTRDRRRPLRS